MQRFAMTVTSKGQVTLPAEFRRSIGAKPGDRLSLLMDDEGRAILSKDKDDLREMQAIARRARAAGVTRDQSPDPIGDHLIAEDERAKSSR
ncbi:MAG: AbrB/MazE/SpoVT family DNA-binding domain-containing protein [Methylobacterium sp.]|uniref:AbrB/MazE/SpoVT family DNA-binding domain-containing protein n=1 Tax=Methylobacterium sp. TaxID=409 RepID=UPI0025D674F7|nr:AbrB/MazE/SpoVT family DNA-binding domain-containing protein [Methylobacterium sp.]MBX9931058.1 AbrB/MazE/SpoVT family DNA-binding domain-containing protein [Methylobacterium sp.]